MRGRAAALLAALALLLGGCAAPSVEEEPAPPLEGVDMDGDALSLADLRGEVVIVAVWASWCGPCRDEFPVLEEALAELGPDGLAVLGVNFRDVPAAAQDFLAEIPVSFPSVVDLDGSLSLEWGVRAVPQAFLIDREGRIVDRQFGGVDDAWIAGPVTEAVGA